MKALVVCREIKRLIVESGEVIIDAPDEILSELSLEKQSGLLQEFFDGRGLKFRLKQVSDKNEDIRKLQNLLGGSLVIK